ncbi:ATAD2B [Cordylochernes scorpioides]|uniref:ATAD2B n=1 Tax=Cordylochernes scorpioides TaxID=51811 RepID=A0ABY6KLL3_9ARAC|nr:ATAD2B [Cordylochernes scorpioides]
MRPSIIFFDEIDGLAPVRTSRQDQIHCSIVSTLLSVMDGLDSRGEIVVIGATNRIDALDPALRRPGRFDREFHFPLPNLQIKECHFERALKKIVPASQRGSVSYIKPLDDYIRPLFQSSFNNVSQFLERVFPQGNPPRQPKKLGTQDTTDYSRIMEWSEDEEENHQVEIMPIENANCLKGSRNNSTHSSLIKLGKPLLSGNSSYRPRLLLCGEGSYNYLAPALLHRMEHIPVHRLDLPTLHLGGGTVEEALCTLWREAQRIPPAVLFLPSLDHWPQELLATLVSLVHLADPRIPTLLLATVGCPISDLPPALLELFDPTSCLTIPAPTLRERREFFMPLLLRELLRPPPELASAKHYPALPEAPLPKPAPPSAAELESLQKEEEKVMRDLRVFLRTILAKLMRDRKFVLFVKPVSPEDAPDYLEVVKNPMCLNVIRCKIDHKQYWSVQDFLNDIDLIYCNALEYNDPIDPIGMYTYYLVSLG